MKWYRIFLAMSLFVVLTACGNPLSAPRLPPADEDDQEAEPDSTKGGFLDMLQEEPIFWV